MEKVDKMTISFKQFLRLEEAGAGEEGTDELVKNYKKGTPGQHEDSDPCWKGYRQLGTKKKNGKEVPNCIPLDEDGDGFIPPKAAQNNAKKVIEWKEKYGDEVDAMTRVGWTRARQLANGDKLSLDVVKRMAQFARHEKNSNVAPEYKNTPWKDKGHVAWLGWGGDAGVNWAKKIVDQNKDK